MEPAPAGPALVVANNTTCPDTAETADIESTFVVVPVTVVVVLVGSPRRYLILKLIQSEQLLERQLSFCTDSDLTRYIIETSST